MCNKNHRHFLNKEVLHVSKNIKYQTQKVYFSEKLCYLKKTPFFLLLDWQRLKRLTKPKVRTGMENGTLRNFGVGIGNHERAV